MSVQYKLVIDADYIDTMIARYYRQRPFLWRLPVQFSLPAVPLAVAWLYGWKTAAEWKDVPGLMVLGWPVFAVAMASVTKQLIFQRIGRNLPNGQTVAMALSDEGVSAAGQHVQSRWDWAAYPQAVRFGDGILLMRPGVIRWMPDSAIEEGTAQAATTLVAAHSKLRSIT